MAKAMVNDHVIAQSNDCIIIENNLYFPETSVNRNYLLESDTITSCAWKGEAHYYHVVVDEDTLIDAAWFYPDPKPKAAHIKNYVAFWNGVTIKK